MPADFPAAFDGLKRVLQKNAKGMVVLQDSPTEFSVVTRATAPNKKPLWFGAVYSKKSAVTYHLLPLYYNPKLHAAAAPELRARMQGKACFNFQRPDPKLFASLDALTRLGREQWERAGFLAPGPITPERLAAALRAAGEDPTAIAAKRRATAAQAKTRRAATLAKTRSSGRARRASRR
jgi:hypothetical protein